MILMTASLWALPDLKVPDPPAPQPGDDSIVEVTVGEMRKALFYYQLVPVYRDHIEAVEQIALRTAEDLDNMTYKASLLQEEVAVLKKQRLLLGSGIAIVTSLLIFSALR